MQFNTENTQSELRHAPNVVVFSGPTESAEHNPVPDAQNGVTRGYVLSQAERQQYDEAVLRG